jgi:hypothetical protein
MAYRSSDICLRVVLSHPRRITIAREATPVARQAFHPRGLSYMSESPPEGAESAAWGWRLVDPKFMNLTFDRRESGQALQPGLAW